MKLSKFTILSLALLMHVAWVSAQESKPVGGEIRGRVVDDRGQPLNSVGVVLRRFDTTSVRTLVTNREGQFVARNLEAGLFAINVMAPAYVMPTRDGDTPPPIYRVGDNVRLQVIRGGVITGTVTNAQNEPAVAIRVSAMMIRDAFGKPIKSAQFGRGQADTDDRGMYRIFGLVPGTYIVEAGGYGATRGSLVTPYDLDAPTYGPSSARDNAAEIAVEAGQEATMDISHRSEPGRRVSGTVTNVGTGGATISLSPAAQGAMATAVSFQTSRDRGFALTGIADGLYDLYATQTMPGPTQHREVEISALKRVLVQGADVTGIELTTKPLASINGRVQLVSSTAAECKGKRRPLLSETMISIRRHDSADYDPLSFLRGILSPVIPDKDGNITWRSVFSGQYTFEPQFFARYWYVQSVTITRATASSAKPSSGNQTIDAAARWTTVKDGERLGGLVVTLAEGAVSIRGSLLGSEGATMPSSGKAFLIPAEREKADDVLRYFAVDVAEDRTFAVDNLPPGRYWVLAQPGTEVEKQLRELRLPEAGEARRKLRRAGELANNEIELKPCQNLTDYQLPIK